MDTANPHSKSLRTGRYSAPNQIYLVTFQTENRSLLFNDWYSGRTVVNELRRAQHDRLAETLCYVVMPDHVHWLLQLHRGSLSDLVRMVKSRSAIHYNRLADRVGPLWQPGFHDHALRAEEDVRARARYVVANPIRKGLVGNLADYSLWDAVWVNDANRGQARSHDVWLIFAR